jgi:hypothetical protein
LPAEVSTIGPLDAAAEWPDGSRPVIQWSADFGDTAALAEPAHSSPAPPNSIRRSIVRLM